MEKLPMGDSEYKLLTQYLKKVSFFAGLSFGDLDRVMSITSLYSYKSGWTLFKRGDPGDALYVVHEGRLQVLLRKFFLLPPYKLATLNSGDIFGEMALLDQPYRTATVKTETECKLFVILSSNFNSLIRENPSFSAAIRQLAEERKIVARSLT